jgi:hypothetical protein
MKSIAVIAFLLLTGKILGQYGLDRYPDNYPDPELTKYGEPHSLEYFKCFGKDYVQVYTFQNEDDSSKTDYYKSFYRLRGNKIRVKTISSTSFFSKIRKYIIIDNEITDCNRIGRIRKYSADKIVVKSQILDTDSVFYQWNYLQRENDTSIWRSTRKIYNKKKQLIKEEVAYLLYAENDSTWKEAETNPKGWGVSRTTFQYLSDNEIKTVYQTVSAARNRIFKFTMTFLYDSNGNLIERRDFNDENKYSCYYKFSYYNGLCISYEHGDNLGIVWKTSVMGK